MEKKLVKSCGKKTFATGSGYQIAITRTYLVFRRSFFLNEKIDVEYNDEFVEVLEIVIALNATNFECVARTFTLSILPTPKLSVFVEIEELKLE